MNEQSLERDAFSGTMQAVAVAAACAPARDGSARRAPRRWGLGLLLLVAAVLGQGLFAPEARAQAACTEVASPVPGGPNMVAFNNTSGSCTASTGVVVTWSYTGTFNSTNIAHCGLSGPLVNDGTFTVTFSAPSRSIGVFNMGVDSAATGSYLGRNVETFTGADPAGMSLLVGQVCTSGTQPPVLEGNSLRGPANGASYRTLTTATYPSAQTSFPIVFSHTNGSPPGPYTTVANTNGVWVAGVAVPQQPKVTLAKTTLNGAGANTFGYTLGSASPVTVQPNPATNSITVTGAATVTSPTVHTVRAGGNLTITENSVPAGWPANPVSVVCTDSTSPTPNANIATLSGNAATIPASELVLGANITCTFTNRQPATLRIQKTRVGDGGSPVNFNFTGTGPVNQNFAIPLSNSSSGTQDYGTANAVTATPGTTALNNLPAGTYTIAEAFTDPNTNNNFELTNVNCVNQAGGTLGSSFTPTLGANGGSATIDLVGGANYLCTFTNTRNPAVTLTKVVQGASATFGFTATPNSGTASNPTPSLTPPANGSASTTFTVPAAATSVTITENPPPAGYVLTAATCTRVDGATSSTFAADPLSSRSVTVTGLTSNSTVSCTFTNAQPATVIFRKQTTGGTGAFNFGSGTNLATTSFALNTATGGNPASTAAINIPNAGQPVTITETIPAGWQLTGATCTNNGSPVAVTLNGGTLTIPGGATGGGSALDCTFNNARRPGLQLQKQLPLGRFAAGDQFNLNIAGAGGPATATTIGSGTTATNTATLNNATPGTSYTFSETGASGADLANYTTTWNCSNGSSGSGTSFSLTAVAGQDVTCTFVNTRNPLADLVIAKTNTIAQGTSDLTGDNVAAGPTTYTLTVTNKGPDAVTGAVVKDMPGTGITCPPGNTVTIDYSGATPDSSSTVGTLTGASGIVLGQLGVNETATLTFSCTVN